MKLISTVSTPRLALYPVLLLLSVLVLASSATAAPIKGAERVSLTFGTFGPDFISAPASCAAFPKFPTSQPDVQMDIDGWVLRADPIGLFDQVWLEMNVNGTITDITGNTYRVHGHFRWIGVRISLDQFFDGVGNLAIVGPHGTFVGQARGMVISGPPERDLIFTDMAVCAAR
jgi:hypothetical protein